jgi:hypothetical protein
LRTCNADLRGANLKERTSDVGSQTSPRICVAREGIATGSIVDRPGNVSFLTEVVARGPLTFAVGDVTVSCHSARAAMPRLATSSRARPVLQSAPLNIGQTRQPPCGSSPVMRPASFPARQGPHGDAGLVPQTNCHLWKK